MHDGHRARPRRLLPVLGLPGLGAGHLHLARPVPGSTRRWGPAGAAAIALAGAAAIYINYDSDRQRQARRPVWHTRSDQSDISIAGIVFKGAETLKLFCVGVLSRPPYALSAGRRCRHIRNNNNINHESQSFKRHGHARQVFRESGGRARCGASRRRS